MGDYKCVFHFGKYIGMMVGLLVVDVSIADEEIQKLARVQYMVIEQGRICIVSYLLWHGGLRSDRLLSAVI